MCQPENRIWDYGVVIWGGGKTYNDRGVQGNIVLQDQENHKNKKERLKGGKRRGKKGCLGVITW